MNIPYIAQLSPTPIYRPSLNNSNKPDPVFWFLLVIIVVLLLITFVAMARAEEYTNEQIVNAIYLAEGGAKAKVPYGILSVKVKDEAEARQVCLNTVRNNRKRYADYGHKQYNTYLEFLASRYAPIDCENDNGTNKYWLKNVKYFLSKDATNEEK